MKRIAFVVAAALMTLTATSASAATVTANLTVNATVSTVCSVQAATLDFPDYDPVTAAQVDGSANVTVKCTSGTPWKLTLAANTGSMIGAGPALTYALFSDAGRNTGFPTAVADQTDVVANGGNQTAVVYGRVAAGQNTVQAGLHTATVLMTITY